MQLFHLRRDKKTEKQEPSGVLNTVRTVSPATCIPPQSGNEKLSNKAYELYQKHSTLAYQLSFSERKLLTEEGFIQFADYRNGLTHGNAVVADKRIVYIAAILRCVIYFSIMSRVGLETEDVRWLIKCGFFE